MSRSIHKTVRGVFGGKSKAEIGRMLDDADPDVEELARKRRYKTQTRDARARQEDLSEPAPAPKEPSHDSE